MFEQAVLDGHTQLELPTNEEYARMRGKYVRDGGGTPPPGATPVDDE
jgi:hypothetical protein